MESKRAKEMITRIIAAIVLIPLALLLIIKAHPHVFFTVIYIISLLAVKEFINIMDNDKVKLNKPVVWLSAVLIPGLIYFMHFEIEIFVVLLLVILFIKLFSSNPTENAREEISYNFFAAIYVPVLFTFFPLIMDAGGYQWVLYLCVLIWASDSIAYFTGVAIGKHKLIPKVSPGKTIEGLTGGIIGAVIVALVYNYYVLHENILFIILISVELIIAGIIGDLIESMLKRSADVKDSGSIIPGHGGILDRFDSLMIAAPVLYFYIQ